MTVIEAIQEVFLNIKPDGEFAFTSEVQGDKNERYNDKGVNSPFCLIAPTVNGTGEVVNAQFNDRLSIKVFFLSFIDSQWTTYADIESNLVEEMRQLGMQTLTRVLYQYPAIITVDETTEIPHTDIYKWGSGNHAGCMFTFNVKQKRELNLCSTPITFDLTTSVDGSGTIEQTPSGTTFDKGTQIAAYATPDTNWEFSNWTRNTTVINGNPIPLAMNQDIDLVAYFTSLLTTIQDVFSTSPIQSGSDWIFEDQIGSNDVQIKDTQVLNFDGTDQGLRTMLDLSGKTKLTFLVNANQTTAFRTAQRELNSNVDRFLLTLSANASITISTTVTSSGKILTVPNADMLFEMDLTQSTNELKLKISVKENDIWVQKTAIFVGTLPSALPNMNYENKFNIGDTDGNINNVSNASVRKFYMWEDVLTTEQKNDIPNAVNLESCKLAYDFQDGYGTEIYNKAYYGEMPNGRLYSNTGASLANMWDIKLDEIEPVLLKNAWKLYESNTVSDRFQRRLNTDSSGIVYPALGANEVPLLVVIGQSNATGIFGTANYGVGDLPVEYQGEQDNIYIYWEGDYTNWNPATGDLYKMNPGVNTPWYLYSNPATGLQGNWSAEQRAAHMMQELTGVNVYVVRNNQNATAISAWASPSGNKWIDLERAMAATISKIEALGKTPRIYTAWLQGEADAASSTTIWLQYKVNLENFINNYRGLSSYLTDSMFTMYRLPSSFGGGSVQSTAFINLAYEELAQELTNCNVINTNGRSLYDTVHYDEQGQLDNGLAWFQRITNQIPEYTKIQDIEANAGVTNSGNTYDGIQITGLETDATFAEILALENSETIEITKTENTVSRLIIKE